MPAVQNVNPNADVIGRNNALAMNVAAAKSLQNALKTNLGPKGTMKMLVSGAGFVKLTKDGKVLLDEMQIQHPTAAIIARTATAQDDITGDGTTSNVLFIGELLKQAERYLNEGLHPRIIVDGFEAARDETINFLDQFAIEKKELSRDDLTSIARTSLRTKVPVALADHLTEIVVNCIETIRRGDQSTGNAEIDLHMVEIMTMKHKSAFDTKFVDGLVLDHGARHPDMKPRAEKCHIFICNVSLEYEKTMVNSGFYYKDAAEREKMVAAERKFTDDKVKQIIAFAESVIGDKDETFVLINQKGIDPPSLDLLQKAGIIGIRRAKRRNMERLAKACGGYAVNSLEDLQPDCLGFCETVYEHVLGEDKFTFVEGTRHPTSCTILIRGPNDHTVQQIQDAVHDGLRAVRNAILDASLVPGAGAFEIAAHLHLQKWKNTVAGRAKLGVQAFADALLVIPKTLAANSGHDAQAAMIDLIEQHLKTGQSVGLDVESGSPLIPANSGIWDNQCVKRQFLHLGSLIAIKILLVDEVMRAGRKMGKG